jgi:type IV pilus assembly protein PilX
MKANRTLGIRHSQQGVVLVVALFFLVIMTVLGLSMASMTTSEERIARNFRDQDVAYAAAEAGLRDAKLHITGTWQWPATPVADVDFNPTCTSGLCNDKVAQPIDSNNFFGTTVPGKNSVAIGSVTGQATIQGVASQPRYLIERVPSILGAADAPSPTYVYRITVQARGKSADTFVVLQEVFVP